MQENSWFDEFDQNVSNHFISRHIGGFDQIVFDHFFNVVILHVYMFDPTMMFRIFDQI